VSEKNAPENKGINVESKEGNPVASMKPSTQGVKGVETKEGPAKEA
jgi:hypothetical protein